MCANYSSSRSWSVLLAPFTFYVVLFYLSYAQAIWLFCASISVSQFLSYFFFTHPFLPFCSAVVPDPKPRTHDMHTRTRSTTKTTNIWLPWIYAVRMHKPYGESKASEREKKYSEVWWKKNRCCLHSHTHSLILINIGEKIWQLFPAIQWIEQKITKKKKKKNRISTLAKFSQCHAMIYNVSIIIFNLFFYPHCIRCMWMSEIIRESNSEKIYFLYISVGERRFFLVNLFRVVHSVMKKSAHSMATMYGLTFAD